MEWYEEGHNNNNIVTRRGKGEEVEEPACLPACQHVIFIIMEEKQPTRHRGTKREDEGDVDGNDDGDDGYRSRKWKCCW